MSVGACQGFHKTTQWTCMFDSWWTCVSLVPRPRLAFHRLQYVKVGRAWYLCTNEHDVIDNGPKILNHKAKFHVLYNELQVQHYLCITYSRPALARYLWKVTWYLSSSCCSKPRCAHSQLSPFYHLFYPWCHACDIRYQALHILRATENGVGLGTRLDVC